MEAVWPQHPALCVDHSGPMLERAQLKEGVNTIKATAEEFFAGNLSKEKVFSKIIVLFCFHHFKDPAQVLEEAARVLSENGVCIILHWNPDNLAPLMFTKAQKESIQLNFNQITNLAESNGLKARIVYDEEACRVAKSCCVQFLRDRMFPVLSGFTDAEIEQEISELEAIHTDEIVETWYKLNLVIITRH